MAEQWVVLVRYPTTVEILVEADSAKEAAAKVKAYCEHRDNIPPGRGVTVDSIRFYLDVDEREHREGKYDLDSIQVLDNTDE